MTEYDNYQKQCDEITAVNNTYLKLFENDLCTKDLAPKTIRRHLMNLDLFLNDYLLRDGPNTMEQGITHLDGFFDFFIRKCMWSTPATVKSTAASIRKFYKCMYEKGKISKDEFDYLKDEIKMGVECWMDECDAYNEGVW